MTSVTFDTLKFVEKLKASEVVKTRRERWDLAFRRSAGTGVYIEIHEDSEHRRNARSRAQQIFSQALRYAGCGGQAIAKAFRDAQSDAELGTKKEKRSAD